MAIAPSERPGSLALAGLVMAVLWLISWGARVIIGRGKKVRHLPANALLPRVMAPQVRVTDGEPQSADEVEAEAHQPNTREARGT